MSRRSNPNFADHSTRMRAETIGKRPANVYTTKARRWREAREKEISQSAPGEPARASGRSTEQQPGKRQSPSPQADEHSMHHPTQGASGEPAPRLQRPKPKPRPLVKPPPVAENQNPPHNRQPRPHRRPVVGESWWETEGKDLGSTVEVLRESESPAPPARFQQEARALARSTPSSAPRTESQTENRSGMGTRPDAVAGMPSTTFQGMNTEDGRAAGPRLNSQAPSLARSGAASSGIARNAALTPAKRDSEEPHEHRIAKRRSLGANIRGGSDSSMSSRSSGGRSSSVGQRSSNQSRHGSHSIGLRRLALENSSSSGSRPASPASSTRNEEFLEGVQAHLRAASARPEAAEDGLGGDPNLPVRERDLPVYRDVHSFEDAEQGRERSINRSREVSLSGGLLRLALENRSGTRSRTTTPQRSQQAEENLERVQALLREASAAPQEVEDGLGADPNSPVHDFDVPEYRQVHSFDDEMRTDGTDRTSNPRHTYGGEYSGVEGA